MEVDHAAQLVLRDLGVLHGGDLGQPGGRDLEGFGEHAAQGDGEPAPQVRCPPLPDHVRGVVVAVRAQRLPQRRVIHGMRGVAGSRPALLTPRPASGVGDSSGPGRGVRARSRPTER